MMMNSFFVYDTVYCKADEDDPKDAVVYFFPLQACESQHYFLCCQLVGVAKFLKSAFSTPSVIGLDQGKFAFLWSGNYLLVLGGNSDVPTTVLKDQLSFLCGIFCFYHGSINNVLKGCDSRIEFLSKMELAWSRYITLSQCFVNVLQLSLSALPLKSYKKSSHVVATANRLLHVCQLSSSVMAGTVFYNSRVLSTQFMPQLTNYLSLLSNANASAPVTDAQHALRLLPPDVELKYVHLNPKLVSSILRYNHTSVGCRIRVKTTTQVSREPLGSGSEGDVDSGNCSERSPTRGRSRRALVGEGPRRSVPCCAGHSGLHQKSLCSSRNRFFQGHETREDSGIQVTSLERESSFLSAVNVLCPLHARLSASTFVTRFKMGQTHLTSPGDLEFKCALCANHPRISSRQADPSLKRWNSDVDISGHARHQCACGHLTAHPRHMDRPRPTLETSKLQILKCRGPGDNPRKPHATKRHSSSKRNASDAYATSGHPKKGANHGFDFSFKSGDGDRYSNVESNELQRHVLYVQRYGCSTLVLLLHKVFDDKVINYLWNCGFTILRELECNAEKKSPQKPYPAEPPFYVLLYNHLHKVLKEYPTTLVTDSHSRRILQQIREDFEQDPHFQMMCLLSVHQNVFACHSDPNLAFYLQAEGDPLPSLSKKAARRLAKYFQIS